MAQVTDPSTIEVANVADKPTEADKPKYDDLNKLLASMSEEDAHPLEGQAEAVVEPVKAVTPTPAAPVVEPQVPSVLAHPKDLLQAARDLGVEERHLAPGVVPTQALLDWVVTARLKDATISSQKAQEAAKPAPVAPAKDEDEEAIAYFAQLGMDEKFISHAKRQADRIKQLESALQKIGDPEKIAQEVVVKREKHIAAQTAFERAVDGSFAALGPKFEKLVGKGTMRELSGTPAENKRKRVYMAAGIDFTKDNAETVRQKISAAATELFGDMTEEVPAAAPATPEGAYAKPTPAEWDNAAIGKPSGKSGSPRDSHSRKILQDYFRDHNITNGAGTLDGVP